MRDAKTLEMLTPADVEVIEREVARQRQAERDAKREEQAARRRVEPQLRQKVEKALPKRTADLDDAFWQSFKQAVTECARTVARAQLQQEVGLPLNDPGAAPTQVTLEMVATGMRNNLGGGGK